VITNKCNISFQECPNGTAYYLLHQLAPERVGLCIYIVMDKGNRSETRTYRFFSVFRCLNSLMRD